MTLRFIGALWCPSCLVMRPRYEMFCRAHDWTFVEFDYDQDEALTATWDLGHILPVAIVLNDQAVEVARFTGEVKKTVLWQRLEDFAK